MEEDKVVAEDYLKLKFVEQVNVSSNYVCWVERQPNSAEKGYKSKVMLLKKSTGKFKSFTSGIKKDFSPVISPNEKFIAFLSTRSGKPQLHLIELDGGEAYSISSMKRGVSSFKWSPDSTKISFVSKILLDEDWKEKPNFTTPFHKEMYDLEEKEKQEALFEPRVLEDHVYRSGTSYSEPNSFSHLFVYDLTSKEVIRVSDGVFNYSNGNWFGNNALMATTVREQHSSTANNATLVKLGITEPSLGEDVITYPSGFLLFLSEPLISQGHEIMIPSVQTVGPKAGQNTKLALLNSDHSYNVINLELDRSIASFIWISEKNGLALVEDSGLARIYSYNTDGQLSQLFEPKACITGFDSHDGCVVYYTATSSKNPWALWKWSMESGEELVYDPNVELLAEKLIVEPEEFWLTNPEGINFQGWFFDASSLGIDKPPMVLSIHGGPHVMWNNAGSMWHEWQMQVSSGYSVLALNPIGSGGYGEKFAQLILSKWGDEDARDLLQAVDHFSSRVDTNRLYITGGSYAGFQTANIISKDHRFKAACSQRGVYNVLTFWMATDIPLWATLEWNWDFKEMNYDLQQLWDHSPTANAHKIKTPVLIIHSENDFRVQISQAEDFFGALKMHDVEAKLVRYPRDGHELSRSGEPLHLIDRLKKMLDWFDSHP